MSGLAFHHRALLGILALAILTVTLFQGSRGLYETTEGRYAECARETLNSKDYDDPILNTHQHWTKPPLTYIAIMGGLAIMGENDWGARAFLILAFILTVLAVFYTARSIWGDEVAPYCALVYATAPFPLAASNIVSTDTLLACFQGLGVMCFWWAMRWRKRRYMILMWAAFGLAFLTKGPPSLLPLLGIISIHYLEKRADKTIPHLWNPVGFLVFLVMGLGWYVDEAIEHDGLMRYWVFHETIGRNLYGEFDRNPQFYKAFVIYLPLLIFGTGPWAILLAWQRKKLPWPTTGLRQWQTWPHAREWAFVVLSILLPLILLSISKSKLPLYALPLMLPLTLGIGKGLHHLVTNKHLAYRTVVAIALSMALITVGIKAALPHIEHPADMKQLAKRLEPILESNRNRPLVSIKPVQLNGLEFYIHRIIPNYSLDKFQEALTQNPNALVLLEKSDFIKLQKKTTDKTALTGIKATPLGRYWVILDR